MIQMSKCVMIEGMQAESGQAGFPMQMSKNGLKQDKQVEIKRSRS